ncbi:MAG: DUF4912 domain-containing protein [Peptococcaceae bacterium]|nr:DUF4912 domain-containing protein [Peptococcaceae bacterium]
MYKGVIESLPGFYDDNIAGFFPQGPGVVFVYWELSGIQWEIASSLGGAVLIRLCRVIEGEGFDYEYIPVSEVDLPPGTNNWYFDGLDPDSEYCFEIGCRLPDGSFFSLVRSEKTATPPVPRFNAPPGEREAQWNLPPGVPQVRPDAGKAEITGVNLDLREVMESMAFYMGYDTQLTG